MPNPPAPLLFDSAFIAKLEQLHVLARKLFRGEHRAERRSRQTGSSLEFADYRNYSFGDDLRSIDWNVYARLDRLFIKLYEQEQDLDIHFLIDASASMRWIPEGGNRTSNTQWGDGVGRESKFDQTRRVAAALSYIALSNLDRVNIIWFGSALDRDLGLVRGKSQFHKILNFMRAAPELEGATELLPSLRSFAQRMKRRGLVFVLSDFFDPRGGEEALSLLRHSQFEVHVVQVLDPIELNPGVAGDLRLTECETGEVYEITATESLLTEYREQMAGFLRDLESFCLRRGIGYAQASTAVPFEELVLGVLRDGVMLK
ncbi:MAG: DUF58 domain-containing protein [Chthoniobacteraceae bacterium]